MIIRDSCVNLDAMDSCGRCLYYMMVVTLFPVLLGARVERPSPALAGRSKEAHTKACTRNGKEHSKLGLHIH